MKRITYIQESLNHEVVTRWPLNLMPLSVYIAPFRWYKAKDDDYKYRAMVKNAFEAWKKVSGGVLDFVFVSTLNESQINIEWKRVDRKSLGVCNFHYDSKARLYSAEVKIGLSDGIIHHQYMDENEVYHTILHEVGHSLGLGHSPFTSDIMYTPHKYGVTSLSKGDIETLKGLYKLPIGSNLDYAVSKYKISASTIDEILMKAQGQKTEFQKVCETIEIPEKDLLLESQRIGELKKYSLELQKIKISPEIIKKLRK